MSARDQPSNTGQAAMDQAAPQASAEPMPAPSPSSANPPRAEGQPSADEPEQQQAGQPQPQPPRPSHPQGGRTSRPEDFRLAGQPPRVMRLSPKALAILALVGGMGIGGALIYGLRASHAPAPVNLIDTSHTAKSDVVTANPSSYDKVPKLGQPLPGDLGKPILAAQQSGAMTQASTTSGQGNVSDQRLLAMQQARERTAQERVAVLGSRLFLAGSTAPSSATSAMADAAPGTGGQALTTGANPASAPTQAKDATASAQAAKRAFMTVAGSRPTVSSERVTEATSPYVVQAGSIIPAALITGIRSDLPGQITAQVTQNVYDSPTGRILLIPQGARLIGEYDSQISAGQNRVLMAWDRLILPDGRSILLDRQPGADASGAAGLQDKTNYHWGNLLKAAAISTMLGVGTEMATDSNDTLVQALRYGTEDTINQVGKQLIQRELGIPPTLTIRPGYPLRIIITRDLVLEPQGGRP